MTNILVFPAGTEIAFEIHAALRDCKDIALFGASSVPCHASFLFESCTDTIPYVDDPELVTELNRLIDMWEIDYVYPAHDSALLKLTEMQNQLKAKVVTSSLETVRICRDKRKTYEHLDGAWYLPKVYSYDEEVTFPVFIKPTVGQGSVGARKIEDGEDLAKALKDGTDYVVCEYLPGDEYTVDCFTDSHGTLRYVGQRTRERIRAGISVRSRFVDTTLKVRSIARSLNNAFHFNGAWFFQIKGDENGEPVLLEVAPRIAGTMCLSRARGVNMPLLTMYNMWGKDVDVIWNEDPIMLDRAFISRYDIDMNYDTVFVDFDDTLVDGRRPRALLLAFLYQTRFKGKAVVLLTKHGNDIYQELEAYAIDWQLFNAIINVRRECDKTDYLQRDSIFIDDSFSERKKAWKKGIPVFDVDAVECLFDWRK